MTLQGESQVVGEAYILRCLWAVVFCTFMLNASTVHAAEGSAADPVVVDEARHLLEHKQAEQAYQLLAPHEADWAGDRDYDYLLGASAVDSKHPSEAILALQRVLAVSPDYSAARMELARAYYEAGDSTSARKEFEELLKENPPPYAKKIISDYLAAINHTSTQAESRFRYFVQFDLGYDGNANGATDEDQFLGFTLNDHNVAKSSGYVGFSNGGTWSNPLSSQLTNYTSFSLSHRRNFSATFVNYDRAGLSDDLVWHQGPVDLNGGISVFRTLLDSRLPFDGDFNQQGGALDLGAHRTIGQAWRFGGDVHFAGLRYDDALDVLDVNQTLYDVTGERYDPQLRQLAQGIALIGGSDNARKSGSPYGRSQWGARYTASFTIDPITRLYFYTGFLKSDYDGDFFGSKREDVQGASGLYLIWKLFRNQNWAVIPRVAYTTNDSRVSLYDYHKLDVALSLRWIAD